MAKLQQLVVMDKLSSSALGHFNVETGCKYWIMEVIELDNIVWDNSTVLTTQT